MTKFLKNADTFKVASDEQLDVHNILPVGVYVVNFDTDRGFFYLKTEQAFTNPKKIYGNVHKHTDRIISTYQKRGKNTGVLLAGEKGSGKTLLARQIAIKLGEMDNVPTIILDQAYRGDKFNEFIRAITQPCIIFIDEFEKVYSDPNQSEEESQASILTLMDGTISSNKLFLLTVNDIWGVNQYLKNRPNRIFYNIKFECLPYESIKEYVDDRLVDSDRRDEVTRYLATYHNINFDMVAAYVEEMNRYGEGIVETADLLNMSHITYSLAYDATLHVGSKNVTKRLMYGEVQHKISQVRKFEVHYYAIEGSSNPVPVQGEGLQTLIAGMAEAATIAADTDGGCEKFTWDNFVVEKSDVHNGKYVFDNGVAVYTLTEQPFSKSYKDYAGAL